MLSSVPVAIGSSVATTVYVTLAPETRSTVSLMSPVPLDAHVAPVDAAHAQVALVNVDGNASVTVAPITSDGPLFVATIVYVTVMPGIAFATASVLVMCRSADTVMVSESVAELFAGVTSSVPDDAAIVAVLSRVPVADPMSVAVKVYVAVAPTGRLATSLRLPVPLEAPQLAPVEATQVQVAPVKSEGSVSEIVALDVLGPLFVATIVYVTGEPAVAVNDASVLVMARSERGVIVSESVAVLLAGVGSVVPAETATDAVLLTVPDAAAAKVAVSV